jgi:hypothetical protein
MSDDRNDAKSHLAHAKQLAKTHRVNVLGWNNKPGREFISVYGDGDRLIALQKELEGQGWYTWPVENSHEGIFMDFARRPPEPGQLADERKSVKLVPTINRRRTMRINLVLSAKKSDRVNLLTCHGAPKLPVAWQKKSPPGWKTLFPPRHRPLSGPRMIGNQRKTQMTLTQPRPWAIQK